MKAAYYFSNEQLRIIREHGSSRNFLPDGTPYTDVYDKFEDDDEIPLKNGFPDSKLVFVKENLPVDEWMLKLTGKRFAKS